MSNLPKGREIASDMGLNPRIKCVVRATALQSLYSLLQRLGFRHFIDSKTAARYLFLNMQACMLVYFLLPDGPFTPCLLLRSLYFKSQTFG